MPNENNPNPENPQPPQPPKPRAPRSDQDQVIANDITDAQQVIETAKTDAELKPLLEDKGYDAAEMDKGAVLQSAAQAAYNGRQKASGKQKEATALAIAVEKSARVTYSDFRETARALYAEEADVAKLGLKGKVPADLQKFITAARASYSGAKDEPYASRLAKRGFKPADNANAEAQLKALATADAEQETAIADAQQATKERDAAYEALMAWMNEFKRIARVALRDKPTLARKLKLQR